MELRLSKDIEELTTKRYSTGYTNLFISLPQREGIHSYLPFKLQIKPDLPHLYSGAWFEFTIKFNPGYPFKPPEVFALNQVYHPNIDLDTGKVYCEALLVDNWKPVMTANSIIFAVELLLYEPNFQSIPPNPMNEEMAYLCQNNLQEFYCRVKQTLEGGLFCNKYLFKQNYSSSTNKKRLGRHSDEPFKKIKTNESHSMQLEANLHN